MDQHEGDESDNNNDDNDNHDDDYDSDNDNNSDDDDDDDDVASSIQLTLCPHHIVTIKTKRQNLSFFQKKF